MVYYCFTNITNGPREPRLLDIEFDDGDPRTGGENATSEIGEISETNASPFSLNRPHKHIHKSINTCIFQSQMKPGLVFNYHGQFFLEEHMQFHCTPINVQFTIANICPNFDA